MSTHQQLLYHIVFSTKNRQRWLTDGFRKDVFAYMAGTAKELNGFAIKVGGFFDQFYLDISQSWFFDSQKGSIGRRSKQNGQSNY